MSRTVSANAFRKRIVSNGNCLTSTSSEKPIFSEINAAGIIAMVNKSSPSLIRRMKTPFPWPYGVQLLYGDAVCGTRMYP